MLKKGDESCWQFLVRYCLMKKLFQVGEPARGLNSAASGVGVSFVVGPPGLNLYRTETEGTGLGK